MRSSQTISSDSFDVRSGYSETATNEYVVELRQSKPRARKQRPNCISISELVAQAEAEPNGKEELAKARKRLSKVIPDEFVSPLQKIRLERGLSQSDVAAMMGVQQPNYAKIENGDGNIYFRTAQKLASILSVDMDTMSDIINRMSRA